MAANYGADTAASVVNEFKTAVKLRLNDLLSRVDEEEEANDVDWAIDELVAAYDAKLHLIKSGKVHPHCGYTSVTTYTEKPTYHAAPAPVYQEQAYEYEAPAAYTYEEPTYDAPHARNALDALSEDVEAVAAVETDNKTEDNILEEDNAVDQVDEEYQDLA